MNILLQLDSADFSHGVLGALNNIQRLDDRVDLMAAKWAASSSQVTRAINEVLRANDKLAQSRGRDAAMGSKNEIAQREAEQKRFADALRGRLEAEEAARADFARRAQAAVARHAVEQQRLRKDESTRAAREAAEAEKQKRGAFKFNEMLAKENRATINSVRRAERDAVREKSRNAREALRDAQQQRRAMLGVSRGIGSVGNAGASAAASTRGMLTFGAGRVAGGVGGALGDVAQTLGSILGPTERIGQTVKSVIGGSFAATGKVVGAFGDLLGLTISGASVAIGKLGGSLLGLIPMIGPALGGIAAMLGEIGGVLGSVVGGAFRVFGEVLGGVGQIAGEVAGGLVSLGVHAVATAARFESLQLSLEVMTGSATRARAIMRDIFQFAAVTPLEVMDVAKATQSLTAVGIGAETALQMVKKLSNISAAMPGDMADNLQHVTRALAQMHAKGTVQAEEMTRQLANAGIPAWKALATQIGVTEAKAIQMARAGQVSARDGIMAILSLADSPQFATMGQRQAQTVFGLWSTLKDNVTFLMMDIGNAIIKGFDLKGAMGDLTGLFGYLRSNLDSIRPAIEMIGTAFRAAFDVALTMVVLATEAFKGWVGQVGAAPKSFQEMRNTIISVMETIATATVEALTTIANEAIKIINMIKNPWQATKDAASAAGPAMGGWFARLLGFTDPTRPRDAQQQPPGSSNIPLFDPTKTLANIKSLANLARLSTMVGAGKAAPPDTGGKPELPLDFDKLPSSVADAIKKTRGPFGDLREQMKDTRLAFEGMVPYQQMIDQLRFVGRDTTLLQQKVTEGTTALSRMAAQNFLSARKAMLAPVGDVAAMEAGSVAAVSAINRAMNEQQGGKDEAIARDLEAMRQMDLDRNRLLEEIAAQLEKAPVLGFMKP